MILALPDAVFQQREIFSLLARHSYVSPPPQLPLCLTLFKGVIKCCLNLLVVLRTKRDKDTRYVVLVWTLASCGTLRSNVPLSLGLTDGNTDTFLNSLTNLNIKCQDIICHHLERHLVNYQHQILLFDTVDKWSFIELKTLYQKNR